MSKHIENVIIGKPLIDPISLLAFNNKDWNDNECEKTVYDEERFLPKILVKYGFFISMNEIKRNRKELWINLDKTDFMKIKIGKKKVWIIIGE